MIYFSIIVRNHKSNHSSNLDHIWTVELLLAPSGMILGVSVNYSKSISNRDNNNESRLSINKHRYGVFLFMNLNDNTDNLYNKGGCCIDKTSLVLVQN